MLRVSLIGHLGGDPELRSSQKGAAMATFSVAVNQVHTDTGTGERQEYPEWFRVRAMGRLAEFAKRLDKGHRVLIAGRLNISHYQSRSGEGRTGFDVWADEVILLSPRDASADETDDAPAARTRPPVATTIDDAALDEDLPF